MRNFQVPRFDLESPQTQLLIDFMKSQGVPLSSWRLLVAPHAHLYFPKSGRIGDQYPPGTGLVLAMFPEGKAVPRLNKSTVYLFVLAGMIALVLAARRRAWFSAGFVILTLTVGLKIIPIMGTLSFSINALLPVLLLVFVLIFVAFVTSERRHKSLLLLIAGILFGLCILIRLPVLLISPAFLVLLWPSKWRPFLRNRLILFGVGAVLAGILPVFAYQQQETGAWYISSYAPEVNSRPTLSAIATNARYYLGSGPGSTGMAALEMTIIGVIGLVWSKREETSKASPLSWARLGAAAFVLWASSTAYFVTHEVTTPYYAIPGTFGALLVLALGSFSIESTPRATDGTGIHRSRAGLLVAACALTPGLFAIAMGWQPVVRPKPLVSSPAHHFVIPAELSDAKAWVWADFLSGTFWYYADKPAYRIGLSDPSTRALLYQFVFDRGEPQYLVDDSPFMSPLMKEISQMGGILEQRDGTVDGSPYFLVRWPHGGPLHH